MSSDYCPFEKTYCKYYRKDESYCGFKYDDEETIRNYIYKDNNYYSEGCKPKIIMGKMKAMDNYYKWLLRILATTVMSLIIAMVIKCIRMLIFV